MGVRDRHRDRARREADRQLERVLAELDHARRVAGLSFDAIGRACGRDGSTVARTIGGVTVRPDLRDLACFASVVGMDLSLRVYPTDAPIRDIAHLRLLGRLRDELAPDLTWTSEVPVTDQPTDRRSWDAVVGGAGWQFGVEAETVLADLQALERRLALKVRDGQLDGLVLLVAMTRGNRRALAAADAALAGFPTPGRTILAALRAGRRPPGSGIVVR